MAKYFPLTIVLVLMLQVPALSAQKNVSGDYEASVMGSVIKARIDQNGEAIQGVADVYSGGKKNTYHFTGSVNGNRIQASHYSGHVFSGNVTPEGDLVGVLKTKGGHKISINAARR
jgi:hypothetical protein